MRLRVVPLGFRAVCTHIAEHHRHHKPPRGGKYFLGVRDGDRLCGVAVIGRPSARAYSPEEVAEIVRTATDGTFNANSKLYGAARQLCKAAGLPEGDYLHRGGGERREPPRGGVRAGGGAGAAGELGGEHQGRATVRDAGR